MTLHRGTLKASILFSVFTAAGGVAVLNELLLGLRYAWPHAHTLSHYLFGLGFPLAWASIFVSPAGKNLKPWQVVCTKWLNRQSRKGIWIGIAITEIWSTWNELLVYVLLNPSHSLDWHHWTADLVGMATSFLIYRAVMVGSFRQRLPPAENS